MGRPKKIVTQSISEVKTADLDVGTPMKVVVEEKVEEVKPTVPTVKSVSYSIAASFKTRSMEGDRITHKYKGVGKTFAEAIESVVGDDEDLVDEYNRPFPKGINLLVNTTVRTTAGHEFSRALAPHVAKDIFENKNVALAARLLGV